MSEHENGLSEYMQTLPSKSEGRTKLCSCCEKILPIENFHVRTSRMQYTYCHECRDEHGTLLDDVDYRIKKFIAIREKSRLSYTKKDLLNLLKRHTGTIDSINNCDCSCPYTANSIAILIHFIGIENNINDNLIEASCKFSALIQKSSCSIGSSRLVTAATILWISSIMVTVNLNPDITQEKAALYFFITTAAIRQRSKTIREAIKFKTMSKFFTPFKTIAEQNWRDK